MSSNPYASPSFDPKQFQDYPSHLPPSNGYGWVQQVRVVAILNCVQGGLEFMLGLGLAGVGIFFGFAMQVERNNPNFRGNNGPPPGVEWLVGGMYLAIGLIIVAAALLRFYAAYRNFWYRGRILGIVSLVCGLASMLACYCAPTGIALLIYGLIVYLNPAVQAAFVMGEQGMKTDDILSSFLPYPPQYFGQPPGYPPPQNTGQSPFGPPPSP